MADWYVSSAAYTAITAFQATHVYSIGDITRPTAPGFTANCTYRCTTAGTSAASEPSWNTGQGSTTTSGTAVFTNVSGLSTYGWSAAAGNLCTITNNASRLTVGDRAFLSSDHSESDSSRAWNINNGAAAFGLIQIISVNRAGSVPPVAADILNGATLTVPTVGSMGLEAFCNVYWQGITFNVTATGDLGINAASSTKAHYFKDCTLKNSGGGASSKIGSTKLTKITLDNTTVQFSHVGQYLIGDITWINTPSALQGATIPTAIFINQSPNYNSLVSLRGIDLSALTTTILTSQNLAADAKILLDSCRIASGVTRFSLVSSTLSPSGDEIELINCYDGTNIINERHTAAGSITTDRSTYLNAGAQDDIGAYSLKMVSNARSDFASMPLDCFFLDVENTATGASKTATVEIISSGSLNNNDIRLQLEYMGTSASPIASFVESLASVLTAASALPSSAVTWISPPATPQKQYLQVTFTPQRAGRVRGLVRLGKVSTTVWVNPQITIS